MNQNAPWWVTPGLAFTLLLIFGGALVAIFLKGDPQQITTMTQAVIALTTLAAGFYFGSSQGSAKKDETIAANAAALATSAPIPAAPATPQT